MADQAEQHQKWWQQIKRHRVGIGVVAIILPVVILLIIVEIRLYGTGFAGKTLWDWLNLLGVLAIPVVAGFGVAWFTQLQQQRDKRLEQAQRDRDKALADQRAESERKAAEQKAELEHELALDNQREAALEVYIDKMAELLLEKQLRGSKPEEEVRKIGRVRTLTVLPRLDNKRKKSVLQFLHESGLIDKDMRIIDLDGADLKYAHLWDADLSGADLSRADLTEARLSGANLSGADLHFAYLYKADLSGANLSAANLSEATLLFAYLGNANLSAANLGEANLGNANLREVNLGNAYLGAANLGEAKLWKADLSGADLSGADLSRANLKGVTGISIEELEKRAGSLKGAIMPDGTIHL